ncbi:ADP-ribosylglycohydrolase family protein [Candidatus Bathyarchaeota archaeon]|nr:ADP-ribosylglycohydrolase family protein [Candidatus Bathyarchaeota archaeon]
MKLRISWGTYWDKVYGCWLGKNAGGTVGGPLEALYGREEMFDVWWYPKLVEGGIPNDDLEIQLVWLQAIKDRGIHLSARDLAEYWLDCIFYNPDEYGLHKTNLNLGLQPPVSGWYNNWFKDCMGSPIRSEIWACIAPGAPNIAARYAYQDAICDHAGGESIYGEIFNAVVESAAFVVSDRIKLVNMGLVAIPEGSLTSKGIRTALEAYLNGLSWKEARERVKEAVYSPVAQYSPINLGFQTIGLLYGENFGDAICKAVNCGWDTDCTGATVGAIWGIIYGRKNLPEEWIKPLGDSVTVSKGIKNIHVPSTLKDLTDDICNIGKKVLSYFDAPIEISEADDFARAEEIINPLIKEIKVFWSLPPNVVDYDLSSVKVSVTYLDGPAVLPYKANRFIITIENIRLTSISGSLEVYTPTGWSLEPKPSQQIELQAKEHVAFTFSATAPVASINSSNECLVKVALNDRPRCVIIPVVFVGGYRWLVSEVFREPLSFDAPFPPEKDLNLYDVGEGWKAISWPENSLEVEGFFENKPGIIYLRHFIYSPSDRKTIIGVPNNSRMKLWLNGKLTHETIKPVPLRPNYSGDGSNYTIADLKSGWNHVMIKLMRGEEPLKAHFTIADSEWHKGATDLMRCRFPWE